MGNADRALAALLRNGFRFTHSLGQNFLLDDGMLKEIADRAGVEAGSNVLEIGAGAGVLTREMASRGANVLAIEVDRALRPVLEEVLEGVSVRLVFEDALKCDLRALTQEAFGGAPFQVVANLPYCITADTLLALFRGGLNLSSVTLMLQKEAAERVMACPGTKAYCALAATVQYFARPEILFLVPPQAFTPPPHVESCLMRLSVYTQKPCEARDEKTLLRLIGASFAMRRKTLANNLVQSMGLSRERALEVLRAEGLDERVRGEVLSLNQMTRLADRILNI